MVRKESSESRATSRDALEISFAAVADAIDVEDGAAGPEMVE